MEIIAVCAIVFVLLMASIAFLSTRNKKPTTVGKRVDNYVLSVDERDGFHFVCMKLQTDDGAFRVYHLDPNYSHVLSDELLTASAQAIRNSHAPAK